MTLSDAIGLELERREAEGLKPYEPWEVVSCPSCGEEWFPEDSLEKIRELNARIEALEKAATEVVECGVDAMAYDRRQVLDALAALLEAEK